MCEPDHKHKWEICVREAGGMGSVIVTHGVWNDYCLCAWKSTESLLSVFGETVESDDRKQPTAQSSERRELCRGWSW